MESTEGICTLEGLRHRLMTQDVVADDLSSGMDPYSSPSLPASLCGSVKWKVSSLISRDVKSFEKGERAPNNQKSTSQRVGRRPQSEL